MMKYTKPHYYYLIPKEQFVEVIGFELTGETRLGNVRLLLHYSILSVVYQASLNYFLLEDFMNEMKACHVAASVLLPPKITYNLV